MTATQLKSLVWRAWRDSALEASDPAEGGVVPTEIEMTIAVGFEAWWEREQCYGRVPLVKGESACRACRARLRAGVDGRCSACEAPRPLAELHARPIVLERDPDEILECVCRWRGKRRDLTLHPRQGFGVCPRCWHCGVERIPSSLQQGSKLDEA